MFQRPVNPSEPGLQFVHQAIGGYIHCGRSHRYITVGKRPMVALFILLFRLLKLSGQPIVVRIASVGEVLPLVGPLSFCLFADFHPFQLFGIGKLTLRQVNGGKPFSRTLRAISRIYSPADSKSASGAWLHSEKPIEGTPFRQPSITTPLFRNNAH